MNTNIVKNGEGRLITSEPTRLTVLEDGTRTRGTMAVAEFTLPPHLSVPFPHIHHAHEEGFYVLEGEIEFIVDNETVRVEAGSFVMVPIDVLHTFANPGEVPARFLGTFTPARYFHFFEEMSALVAKSGPPTPDQRRALMARYDTEMLG